MRLIMIAALAMAMAASGAQAQSGYTAEDLLSPCQEADNDSRRWGEIAEMECEQYILGFIDALKATGDTSVCVPAQNTADEARWAFMRWVHGSFSQRKAMRAQDALLASLRERFGCN